MIENQAFNPPVFLAPLAGITDLPFRKLVSSFGAGLVVSEMIASQEIVQDRPSSRAKAELGFGANHTSIQLAGRDRYWLAKAAQHCEANGAKIIDINMGCPAKKVTNGYSGSALLKTPDLALELIGAVLDAVSIPVTLKTRLGWDENCKNAALIIKAAQELGVKMITVHARTRCQFYRGRADWATVGALRNMIHVPLIVNGDISCTKSARTALSQSRADGVMIGRGAQGRPWLLAEIAHDIYDTPAPKIPKGIEFIAMIIKHYQSMLHFYGTALGNKTARKHLSWYMDELIAQGYPISPNQRRALLTQNDPQKVIADLQHIASQ